MSDIIKAAYNCDLNSMRAAVDGGAVPRDDNLVSGFPGRSVCVWRVAGPLILLTGIALSTLILLASTFVPFLLAASAFPDVRYAPQSQHSKYSPGERLG